MTTIQTGAPAQPKTAEQLKVEYHQIRKKAEKDLRDLNSGRGAVAGFIQQLFRRTRRP